MACGYQMASHSFAKDLAQRIPELGGRETLAKWQFTEELEKITSSTVTGMPS